MTTIAQVLALVNAQSAKITQQNATVTAQKAQIDSLSVSLTVEQKGRVEDMDTLFAALKAMPEIVLDPTAVPAAPAAKPATNPAGKPKN